MMTRTTTTITTKDEDEDEDNEEFKNYDNDDEITIEAGGRIVGLVGGERCPLETR